MNRTAVVQVRINPKIKDDAQKILERLNISMSGAITIFFTAIKLHKGLPFDIRIPNKLTAETIRKSRAGIDIHKVSNVNELIRELEN